MGFQAANKFIVANTKAIVGTWWYKFAKEINANVISVDMQVNFVGFDGSRRTGYKGGPSMEAGPYLSIRPNVLAANEKGGLAVWSTAVGGNNNWVGPNGMDKTSSSTTIFGSAKGDYVIDINQEVYLTEVENLSKGLNRGFVKAMMTAIE